MANQYGFDLGNALATAEDIKAARMRNAVSAQSIQDQNAFRGAATAALPPGSGPIGQAAVIDPQKSAQFLSVVQGMDDTKKAQVQENIDKVGQAASYILSQPEDQQAATYLKVKGMLDPKVRASMPATFDKDWVSMQLVQATHADQLMKSGHDVANGVAYPTNAESPIGKLALDLHNRVITQDQFDAGFAKETKAALQATGIKESDMGRIQGITASQFGGTYDPMTGSFAGLDPTQAPRALAVMSTAAQLYQQHAGDATPMDHATAVKQAMAMVAAQAPPPPTDGAAVPTSAGGSVPVTGGNDPLGIR